MNSARSVARGFIAGVISFGLWAGEAGAAPAELTPAEVAELLVSDRAGDVARGEVVFAAQRTALITALLERLRTGDTAGKGEAVYDLGSSSAPWIRGKEASARFLQYTSFQAPRRPVERVPQMARAEEIRQTLKGAIVRTIQEATAYPAQSFILLRAIGALCKTLGEVADDGTMDWVMRRLQEIETSGVAGPLIAFADSYLGVPPVFRCDGLWGNSTETEVEVFKASQKSALADAHAKLDALWVKVRPMDREDRIAFAMKAWRDHFIPMQRSSSGGYGYYEWVYSEMEPLIRFGNPAVELLRAQQAKEPP